MCDTASDGAKRKIEELSLSGWPALQTTVYDGWVLRFADGHTNRSNSVNPLYASTLPLADKIDCCEEAYGSRRLPTVFKLVGLGVQKGIDETLAARGYERINETSVRTLGLSGVDGFSAPGIETNDGFDDEWLDGQCACAKIQNLRPLVGKILGNMLPRIIAAKARLEGRIVGCGYGAVERAYVGLFDIVVDESARGRGIGEGIVRAILGRASAQKVERAYLQVMAGNRPAEKLYEKIGFREDYRYWYRKSAP